MKALAVMVVAVWVSGCANPVDDDPGGGVVVDLSSHEQVLGDWVIEGSEPASDAPPGDGTAPPVGCVAVQYCDAPGRDGTRCVQTGCSVAEALTACSREAPRECARIVCPFVFVAPGGKRFQNGSCF